MSVASSGYFDAMRIRLLRGRGFLASDALGGAPVVVINEVLGQSVFGGEDPLGRRVTVRFEGQPLVAEVVGVVGSVRQARLERAAAPELYLPHSQFPFGSMTFVVRARVDAATLLKDVQRAIWKLDPQQTFARVGVVSEMVARTISDRLFLMSVSGAFAGVALLLAAVGAYGLLSYLVSSRTREFGVRMALGAGTDRILGLVLREGCGLLAIGLGVGLVGAVAAGWALRAFLYGISPFDPATLLSVALAVTAVSLVAFGGPALRAARVDPARALRTD
jgi:predicted lysophospholipase L1 biosynthesis ABC-type transport system permease subunit